MFAIIQQYFVTILLILCGLGEWFLVEPVTLGDVRLVGGSSELEGRVEIYVEITDDSGHYDFQWWTVCDDLWDLTDADVVCKQLGHGPALSAPGEAYFGSGEKGIYLDNVNCDGTEQTLLECSASVDSHDCAHYEDAGVSCAESQVDGTLRLSDGPDQFEGHLQVYLQDVYQRWGAICSDGWGWNETNTACTILGFGSGSSYTAHNLDSSGVDVEVTSVQCNGSEANLLQCSHEVESGGCVAGDGIYIACKPKHGTVRLTNGDTIYEGRVEIYDSVTETWGAICDDSWRHDWSVEEMDVTCKQLGFVQSATTSYVSYSKTGVGNIFLRGLECDGTEDSLLDCPYLDWAFTACTETEVIGVVCEPESVIGTVRLADGDSSNQGRIEIYNHDERRWEAACSTSWDINDSNVVCRQLGYLFAFQLIAGGYFGEDSSAAYHGTDYYCAGDEATLLDCIVSLTPTQCAPWDHSLQAGVICSDGDDGTISSYIRLVDGSFAGQGRLEVYYNNEWGSVCDDYWSNTNSDVVCQHLGYDSALDFYINVYDVGVPAGSGRIWLDDISCSGMESSFFSCSHSGWGYHNCDHSEDVAVVCSGSVSSTTQIRIVDGSTSSSGRVEVYYNNVWSTICGSGWGFNDAEVACTMAGFHGAESHSLPGAFGQGTGVIFFAQLECAGTEESLVDCPNLKWSVQECSHDYDAGVICLENDIRLVGGKNQFEGTVELYHNDQWGSICNHDFDKKAGNVVCHQLGYGTFSLLDQFEEGTRPILFGNVGCSGTEDKVLDCSISDSGDTGCEAGEEVGVVCHPLENGVIRLVDGASMYEGRVEIYYNNEWGTICDDNWHLVDGDVVCEQLGYGYATLVFSNAYFGSGDGPILLDDVSCTGKESSLSDCTHNGWEYHNCVHREDAGVQCSGTSESGGLGMGSICGIIVTLTVSIFLMCSISKYIKNHPRENCGEKITSICGCTNDTSRTIDVSSTNHTRWQRHNGGYFNDDDERTFSVRDASIFYRNGPYPAVNISGLGQNTVNLNQLRTRDGLSVLPPSYDACMQLSANGSSIHGFPGATQLPSLNVPSTVDHIELPSSPPPPYESVVSESDVQQSELIQTSSNLASRSSNTLRTISASHPVGDFTDRILTPVGH